MKVDDRDAERDRHDHDKRHRSLQAHVLEAVKRHVGHHRQAGIKRDRQGDPTEPRAFLDAIEASVRHHPDEPHHHGRRGRAGQALKESLVDDRQICVEARQSQGGTGAVDKRDDPAGLAHVLECPDIHDQCRSRAERHHVGQAVHLLAERALRVGHARHAAVQTIEHHGAKNAVNRQLETTVDGHHHRIKAAEQGRQREQIRQNVDALAAWPWQRFGDFVVWGFKGLGHDHKDNRALRHESRRWRLRLGSAIQAISSWTDRPTGSS